MSGFEELIIFFSYFHRKFSGYALSIDEWNKIYEKLFGGFEDLDVEEVRSVDSEEYETDELTEQGYLKDNFVVDDDELQEEEYVSYDEDEHEFI